MTSEPPSLADLSAPVAAAFRQAYKDFVVRDTDRTDADLGLLEASGIMVSRVLADDDDFFGLDSLEPGECCYEFTRYGQALLSELYKERVMAMGSS